MRLSVLGSQALCLYVRADAGGELTIVGRPIVLAAGEKRLDVCLHGIGVELGQCLHKARRRLGKDAL